MALTKTEQIQLIDQYVASVYLPRVTKNMELTANDIAKQLVDSVRASELMGTPVAVDDVQVFQIGKPTDDLLKFINKVIYG